MTTDEPVVNPKEDKEDRANESSFIDQSIMNLQRIFGQHIRITMELHATAQENIVYFLHVQRVSNREPEGLPEGLAEDGSEGDDSGFPFAPPHKKEFKDFQRYTG